jgi:hypothetical protein
MVKYYFYLLALLPIASLAQAPAITTVSPAINAQAAPRLSPVAVTFSHNLTPSSSAALRVYSAQRGGLRSRGLSLATVSGSTLTFNPGPSGFEPGEVVFSTITTAAANSTASLARAKVIQFTAASGGTGRGNFRLNSNLAAGQQVNGLALGDVDNDGDQDLLTVNKVTAGTVSIRLNGGDATGSNTGVFSQGSTVGVGHTPQALALGDVDGDGDLDLLTANAGSNTVSIRLNGGDATSSSTGLFSNGSDVPVGRSPSSIALGDIDGDGDLDLLAANASSNTVSIRLNGGDGLGTTTGTFGAGNEVDVNQAPTALAIGDIDKDGDLDLLTANSSNSVSIRLNGGDSLGSGTGVFSGGSSLALSAQPSSLVLGDVDGDGDLDVAAAIAGFGTSHSVSICLNGGDATGANIGRFSIKSEVAVGSSPTEVALSDVDGDGDLDLLTTNRSATYPVSVRLNGGDATGSNTGLFSRGATIGAGFWPTSLVLGDIDGDGDLDLLTANDINSGVTSAGGVPAAINVLFNEPTAPTITSLTPTSGVAGTRVVLTGTNLSSTNVLTINGTAVTGLTVLSNTSLAFLVPAGTGTTGGVSVSTTWGTAGSTGFTPLITYTNNPIVNAGAIPLANSVAEVAFSEPVTGLDRQVLKVYSAQAGGKKAGTVTTSGTTMHFAATAGTHYTNFKPGELINVSVTPARNTGGLTSVGRTFQFTTATGGTGRGNFANAVSQAATVTGSTQTVVGDADGDGDLDLFITDKTANAVNVRLNGGDATGSNTGTFSNGFAIATYGTPTRIALGDLDGDGDLDLVAACRLDDVLSVRFNKGTAGFNGYDIGTGYNTGFFIALTDVTLGDFDNDGYLDIAVTDSGGVTVFFSGGDNTGTTTGVFAFQQRIQLQPGTWNRLQVADFNNDGWLDILALGGYYSTGARFLLNGGNRYFLSSSTLALIDNSTSETAVGDLDGDQDVDFVTVSDNGKVGVFLNQENGSGNYQVSFSRGVVVPDLIGRYAVALADVDADGDLDLIAGTSTWLKEGFAVRLNGGNANGGGQGIFSNGTDTLWDRSTSTGTVINLSLGDIDGDGDLDAAATTTVASSSSVIYVAFNGGTQVLAAAIPQALPAALTLWPTIVEGSSVHYTCSSAFLTGEALLTISTITGQLLQSQKISAATASGQLSVAHLANGWYIVRLVTASSTYSCRFYQP